MVEDPRMQMDRHLNRCSSPGGCCPTLLSSSGKHAPSSSGSPGFRQLDWPSSPWENGCCCNCLGFSGFSCGGCKSALHPEGPTTQLATLVSGLGAGPSGLFYRKDIAEGVCSDLQRAVAGHTEDEGCADALGSLQRSLECCGAEDWRHWLNSDWAIQHMTFLPAENGGLVSFLHSCCVKRKGCRNQPLQSDDNEGVAAAETHTADFVKFSAGSMTPSSTLLPPCWGWASGWIEAH
ncbi:hypothetical protein CRENBAI_002597 [Crenichthys baileyi]|uniref:Uncharacterized protein n=1 Tax=Crenichthys baileyi TaxID=28760 RepID=A0AAV9RGR4_9TELE